MPRPKSGMPSYRLHKPSGQAVVTISGSDHYLGLHDTPQSKQKYARLVQEWIASNRVPLADCSPAAPAANITINELVLTFWEHVKVYYVNSSGEPTGEQSAIKYSLRPLVELYGDEPAGEFGPRKLKAVRAKMVEADLARSLINHRINRIRHLFKWGVENEMVPATILDALRAVAPLKRGRCNVRETEPVKPVDPALVDAIEPFVTRQVWAMIQLQLRTAMRPGEVLIMKRGHLDTSGQVWVYTPPSHKTAHHGHQRRIYLGPQAQKIIMPFLNRPMDAYLFSSAEADKERRDELTASTPNGGRRVGKNRRPRPQRKPGNRYRQDSYRKAITRGCKLAFPPPDDLAKRNDETVEEYKARLTDQQVAQIKAWHHAHHWHPHQLRHNAATFLRQEFGLEAARLILGHCSVTVTELYAELNHSKAVEIIAKVG